MNMRVVFGGLAVAFLLMIAVYFWFSGMIVAAVIAAIVMAITGFFFAAVSGNLVGMIGSSNNPISGLTLSTLLIAALLMVAIGAEGMSGVAAVLGVAAVVCISMRGGRRDAPGPQGGPPARRYAGEDAVGRYPGHRGCRFRHVLPAAHPAPGQHHTGGIGFGDPELPAPQAGLMAAIAQGVVGGEMAWPLIIVGILMGLGFVLLKVRSPMLVSVGMYLPLETTFAIFCGGIIRWLCDKVAAAQAECRPAHAHRQCRRAGGLGPDRRRSPDGPWDCRLRLLRQQRTSPASPSAPWPTGSRRFVLAALAVYMIVRPLQAPAPLMSRRRPVPSCKEPRENRV